MNSPVVPADLAAKVLRRADLRHHLKTAGAALAAAAVFLVAIFLTLQNTTSRIQSPSANAPAIEPAPSVENFLVQQQQLKKDLAQLRLEAKATGMVIRNALQEQKQRAELAKFHQRLAAIGRPYQPIDSQLELAAATTLKAVQEKCHVLTCQQADYRKIIELFPNTQAAQQARLELENIQTQTKGELL